MQNSIFEQSSYSEIEPSKKKNSGTWVPFKELEFM